MKIIKIIFAISLLTIATIGCSNNEDLDANPNLIIGKWKLQSKFYTDGTPSTLNECELKSSFNFRDDNTLDSENFKIIYGNCDLQNGERTYIDYKIENNVLEINSTYIDARNKINSTSINPIKFPNNNTLEIYFYDENWNVYKQPGEIWKRVE